MPECFGGCGKDLPEYGYCEECEWRCPVCDGSGKAKGILIGGDVDLSPEELTIPRVLTAFAQLLENVLSQGGRVHNIGILQLEMKPQHIRIRVSGHKFFKTKDELDKAEVKDEVATN